MQGIPDIGALYAIVDGTIFQFRISKVKREQTHTNVVGILGERYEKSADELWSNLANARSFRVHLPNGQSKDARTAGFSESVARLKQCSEEAAALNKAAGQ